MKTCVWKRLYFVLIFVDCYRFNSQHNLEDVRVGFLCLAICELWHFVKKIEISSKTTCNSSYLFKIRLRTPKNSNLGNPSSTRYQTTKSYQIRPIYLLCYPLWSMKSLWGSLRQACTKVVGTKGLNKPIRKISMSYINVMAYMVITKCQPFRAHFHMPTKLVKGTRSQNRTCASHTQHPHPPHIHMEKVGFEEGGWQPLCSKSGNWLWFEPNKNCFAKVFLVGREIVVLYSKII